MIREIWNALKRWWAGPSPEIRTKAPASWKPNEPVPHLDNPAEDVIYAVSGKPRHTPWPRRKKELEAAARQKRRQIEEFRSE